MCCLGAFFAVYDGHNGDACSKYCAKHLHKVPQGADAVVSERKGQCK